ncbi:hypothetical protein E3N88_10398 [Mikania micrantha]|uniref:Uncharacterized protein n=1 Tax=Mikania micrantha TaxID=192012 RepID=A0A5N6PCS1_9ASTR|nr:hypothetical protein E3N88_10398 [Mikania micrantha]
MARTRGRPANRRNNNDNTRNIDPTLLAAVNQAVENAIAQSVPQAVANALQNNRQEHNNEQPTNNDQPENNQPENNAPAAHDGKVKDHIIPKTTTMSKMFQMIKGAQMPHGKVTQ